MSNPTIETDVTGGQLHFIDESTGDFIRSCGGDIYGIIDGVPFSVNVGNFWLSYLGRIRTVCRLLRIHRINVLRISKTRLLIIYRNQVFVYTLNAFILRRVYQFQYTHYVHTQSISVYGENIVIGEYGRVGRKKPVGVLISSDGGSTWRYKALFAQGLVKNILAIKYDPYAQIYWVFTGDTEIESGIYLFDNEFTQLSILGTGLDCRAISSFFLPDRVVWLTNNPFGTSRVQIYDRTKGRIEAVADLPGPVWYSTEIGGDVYCCTAAEHVAGEPSKNVYLLHSRNFIRWDPLCTFKKDGLNKRLFLYGLGTFPVVGAQSCYVYMNMDAVEFFDGCVVKIPRFPIPHVHS